MIFMNIYKHLFALLSGSHRVTVKYLPEWKVLQSLVVFAIHLSWNS
jgi:hypothetical protein